MSGKSMKTAATLAAMVVVVALLVASCGPAPTPEVEVAVTATPEPVAEAEGPVSGGQLTVGFETTIEDTGDLHRTWSSHSAFLAGNVLDTLIQKNPEDGKYYPALAESWEIADDSLSITLHLRKDVKFHDGTPFNAEAVKYNLDRLATLPEAAGGWAYTNLGAPDYFDKVEVVDEYTVNLFYKKIFALMVDSLTLYTVGGIHSPAAIEKYGDTYGTDMTVGTGPFEWVEWTGPAGKFTCERNEDYNWASPFYKHQGPAYLDGFTFKGMVEPNTRLSALESGAVDVTTVQAGEITRLEESPDFKTWPVPFFGGTRVLLFNLDRPIVKDIRVRQAIAHAIDREGALNSPRFAGVGSVAMAPLTAATWGPLDEFEEYNYLYDPDKAKSLLEEAGWKDEDGDGVREAHGVEGIADGTKLHVVEDVLVEGLQDSEMVQGMLSKVGIEEELVVHDFDTWVATLREGDFDMSFWSAQGSNFFVVKDMYRTGAVNNFMHYSNPEVDRLFDAALATTALEEQRGYYSELLKIIIEDVPVTMMIDGAWPFAMKEDVMDLTYDSFGVGLYLYDAWINPNP